MKPKDLNIIDGIIFLTMKRGVNMNIKEQKENFERYSSGSIVIPVAIGYKLIGYITIHAKVITFWNTRYQEIESRIFWALESDSTKLIDIAYKWIDEIKKDYIKR